MNKGIAHILMQKLTDIPFIQKFGGLVYTQEQPDELPTEDDKGYSIPGRKVLRKFPVTNDYCITKDECQRENNNDFTLDSSYYGQLYFEDQGITPMGREGRNWKFKSNVRLVTWINTKMVLNADTFEQMPGHSISTAIFAMIQERLATLDNKTVGFYQRINVKERGMPVQDKNVFSQYTYDLYATQYVMAPYEFFAVDYEVIFRIHPECITDLAVSLEDLPCDCENPVTVPVQYPALNDLLPYKVELRIGVDTNTGAIIKPNEGVLNANGQPLELDKVVILSPLFLGSIAYQGVPMNEAGDSFDFTDSAETVESGLLTFTCRKKIV